MKIIKVLGYGLTSVAATLMSGNAFAAASTVYAGSVCHNYVSQDASEFEFYGHGITNSSTITKKVICPVAKRINDMNGIGVKVNIDAKSPNTISCTLFSYNINGNKLGYATASNKAKGKETLTMRTPASTTRSHSSVLCSLPGNEDAEIYSIEVFN